VRGLFVTATDTGVGKTVLSAALLAAMSAAGERVRAHKPVVTGLHDPDEIAARGEWPPDDELLAAVAGMDPDGVSPYRYGPAVSPHLAAQLAGERIDPEVLLAHARSVTMPVREADAPLDSSDETVIVEGVGGLLTPLADDYSVCDHALALGLPVLIAARPGLGTINHTLLTLTVARTAGLKVLAIVFTPWPERPTAMQRSNRETIARLGEIEVQGLVRVRHPDPAELCRAGETLPWRRWLDGG
jgi:dethiobiotin synthetase